MTKKHDAVRLAYWTSFREFASISDPKLEFGLITDGAKMVVGTSRPDDVSVTIRADRNVGSLAVVMGLKAANREEQWRRLKEDAGKLVKLPWEWQPDRGAGTKSGWVVCLGRPLDLETRDNWREQHEWLVAAIKEIHEVLIPRLIPADIRTVKPGGKAS